MLYRMRRIPSPAGDWRPRYRGTGFNPAPGGFTTIYEGYHTFSLRGLTSMFGRFDRAAYQREYMRKRRAAEKKA